MKRPMASDEQARTYTLWTNKMSKHADTEALSLLKPSTVPWEGTACKCSDFQGRDYSDRGVLRF